MAKTKTCVKCWTKLTMKNSVPNGMWRFRNMCREHWREYQRDLAAKRKSKSKKVVKEVKAPEIQSSYHAIAKSEDWIFKIWFTDEQSMNNFKTVINKIDEEIWVVLESRDSYKRNATIFVTITAVLGVWVCLVAGLNAFGVLNLFK